MTRTQRSISTLADGPVAGTALALTLVALALLGVATAGPATAQSDQPTVRVVGDETPTDGTATVRVVLTAAPDGLSGYYLDLSLDGTGTARIDSAAYPDRFGLTSDPAVGDDGRSVTLEAADTDGRIDPGATDVTLATVELAGVTPGEAELTVEPRQFDDDDGGSVRPAARSGTVTVTGDDADADGSSAGVGTGTADGATGTDASPGSTTATDGTGAATGSERTDGSGPLSPVLVLLALGVVAALAARRHRP